MKLRPFFSYFGGKWRIAPHYPPPHHALIVEPFAGSAGYALRHFDHRVHLYDLNPVIVGVWRYLIRARASEIRRLPDVTDRPLAELRVCEEARHLIGFWASKANTVPARTPSAWQRSGLYPKWTWGAHVRDRIATQVEAIRHWLVTLGDYTVAPDVPATWFVDPPYEVAGHRYTYADIDYVALARWCKARRGQVIACENVGARWLPFTPFRSARGTVASRPSAEAVWYGGR